MSKVETIHISKLRSNIYNVAREVMEEGKEYQVIVRKKKDSMVKEPSIKITKIEE
jgi:hypothetical protein